MTPAIQLVADVKALLGEGPVWVEREQALYWVDIKGRRILRLGEGGLQEWATPVRVGSLAPRDSGGFIAGMDRGFYAIDLAGEGVFQPLGHPEEDRARNRFNDGKVDRSGHFWAGTMDDGEEESLGALYRLDSTISWTRVQDGYAVTNGPAFSPDGRLMYHTDSGRRTIYKFDLGDDGTLGERRVFAHFTGAEGYPDGMTVDVEGCVWVAFWDGWAVRRFSPGGELLTEVPVPVQRPTSVAFGGPELKQLYITSARIGLDEAALAVQPSAGGLFMFEPGCRGIAERPFVG